MEKQRKFRKNARNFFTCEHEGRSFLFQPGAVPFFSYLGGQAVISDALMHRICEFLCAGTSGRVYPAASLPQAAARAGAFIDEINSEETALTAAAHAVIRGRAGEITPALPAALEDGR